MRLLLNSTIFFFNDTATTEIYTLSLHDALPILFELAEQNLQFAQGLGEGLGINFTYLVQGIQIELFEKVRSEEHTSELQSRQYLVCRLLLEKKKTMYLMPSLFCKYRL